MLSLNLNQIFKARGIERPYTFLVKAGFTPHSANALLNSKTKTFRLDHIENIKMRTERFIGVVSQQ